MPTLAELYKAIIADDIAAANEKAAKEKAMDPNQPMMSGCISQVSIPDYKKQVDDMKTLMSNDVVALAAGDKEAAATLQVLDVRGRKIIISTKKSPERTAAVTFACLYAAGVLNPMIDDVLRQAGVRMNFVAEDGTVQQEALFDGPFTETGTPAVPTPEPSKRNIIMEDEPAVPKIALGDWVATKDADGKFVHIGMINALNVKSELAIWHAIRTIDGLVIQARESDLHRFKDFADASDTIGVMYRRG